jgi:hypothetical protein
VRRRTLLRRTRHTSERSRSTDDASTPRSPRYLAKDNVARDEIDRRPEPTTGHRRRARRNTHTQKKKKKKKKEKKEDDARARVVKRASILEARCSFLFEDDARASLVMCSFLS